MTRVGVVDTLVLDQISMNTRLHLNRSNSTEILSFSRINVAESLRLACAVCRDRPQNEGQLVLFAGISQVLRYSENVHYHRRCRVLITFSFYRVVEHFSLPNAINSNSFKIKNFYHTH